MMLMPMSGVSMDDWNEVQLNDIQASLCRMHRRAVKLDRDGDFDAADRLRDEIARKKKQSLKNYQMRSAKKQEEKLSDVSCGTTHVWL